MLKLLTLILCLGGCIKPTVEPPAGQTVYLLPTAQPPALGVLLPGFITPDRLEDAMVLDLQNLGSRQEREDTRYLIGCDRFNQGLPVAEFEQGINLAMNRLSNERFTTRVTPIGQGSCIYRISLDAYSLTYDDWHLLEREALLDFVPDTNRNATLQALTQTLKPYLFAVDMTLTAYEGDEVADRGGLTYYTLTDQAFLTKDFLAQEGINLQDEIDSEDVLFSGFSQSQIALRKGRLVQLINSDNGYCMGTFDTALGGDDIFTNPFSLELAQAGGRINSDKILAFDAQEWICSLNNGLFGRYRLNNNQDGAESEAPTNIVINVNNAATDGAIRIGDCNGCHYTQVAIPFSDQLAAHLRSNSAFNADEKLLGDIFFRYDKISAVINDINRTNARVLQDLGVTASVDPLTQTVWKPFREEMNATQVAAFTFLTTQSFLERLRGTDRSSQVFGNLLNGGTVSLATLSGGFEVLVAELGIFRDNEL